MLLIVKYRNLCKSFPNKINIINSSQLESFSKEASLKIVTKSAYYKDLPLKILSSNCKNRQISALFIPLIYFNFLVLSYYFESITNTKLYERYNKQTIQQTDTTNRAVYRNKVTSDSHI